MDDEFGELHRLHTTRETPEALHTVPQYIHIFIPNLHRMLNLNDAAISMHATPLKKSRNDVNDLQNSWQPGPRITCERLVAISSELAQNFVAERHDQVG
jgi:hypothetical protein